MGEQATLVTVRAGGRIVHRIQSGAGEDPPEVDEFNPLRGRLQAQTGPELRLQFTDDIQSGGPEQQGRRCQGGTHLQQVVLLRPGGDLPGEEGAVEGGDSFEFVPRDVEVDEHGRRCGFSGIVRLPHRQLAQPASQIEFRTGCPGEKIVGQVGDRAVAHGSLF